MQTMGGNQKRLTRNILLSGLGLFLVAGMFSAWFVIRVAGNAKESLDALPKLEQRARSLGLPLTLAEVDAMVRRPGGEATAVKWEAIQRRIASLGGASFAQREDAVGRAASTLDPAQISKVLAPYRELFPAILEASSSTTCRFSRKKPANFALTPDTWTLNFSCRLLIGSARLRFSEGRREEGLKLLTAAARVTSQLTCGSDLATEEAMAGRRTILRRCLGIVEQPWANDSVVRKGLKKLLDAQTPLPDLRKSLVGFQVAYGCELFERLANPNRDRFLPETERALESVPHSGLRQFGLVAKSRWLRRWCEAYAKLPRVEEDWRGYEREVLAAERDLLKSPWPLPALYHEFFDPDEDGRPAALYATNVARERLVRLALDGWKIRDGVLVSLGSPEEIIDPLTDKPFRCYPSGGVFVLRSDYVGADLKKPLALGLPQSNYRVRTVGGVVTVEPLGLGR